MPKPHHYPQICLPPWPLGLVPVHFKCRLCAAQTLAARGIVFQTTASMDDSVGTGSIFCPASSRLMVAACLQAMEVPSLCLEHWECSLQTGVREAGLTVESFEVCSEKAHSLGTHSHGVTWISVPRTAEPQGLLIYFIQGLFHANGICPNLQFCP